jgi:NAD+ synthase (glutamine-hydrolysing)
LSVSSFLLEVPFMLKIAVAQLNYTIGDFVANGDAIIGYMGQAASDGADIVVFSELSLCGYYPGDLLDDIAFLHRMGQALERVRKAGRRWPKLVAVLGAARPAVGRGKGLHNALLALCNGNIVAEYHKQYHMQSQAAYGLFDERRHCEAGPERACLLDVGGHKVGLMICEDGWNTQGADYRINPFNAMREAKPDLVISINASPSAMGRRGQRHALFAAAAKHTRLPLLYVNQVGGQDQLVYDGASFAVSPAQGIAFEAARFVEDFQMLGFSAGRFTAADGGALPSPDKDGMSAQEFAQQQIVLGLSDYARRCAFVRVVVGVSSGVDSAVTLALAVQALGASNVFAVSMPSAFSNPEAADDCAALCDNLGVHLYRHPINGLLDQYAQDFTAAFDAPLYGVARDNIQARIRGAVLMEFCNAFGALLLSCGNKSEMSLGHSTLYGDTHSGLGLIGDLYETEIHVLAHFLSLQADRQTGRDLIPAAILGRLSAPEPPTGNSDGERLPPYEILDEVLKWHVEGVRLPGDEWRAACLFVQHLVRTEEGRKTVAKILRMVAASEFKRRQAGPLIRLRARAFGSGRQFPVGAHYC